MGSSILLGKTEKSLWNSNISLGKTEKRVAGAIMTPATAYTTPVEADSGISG